MPENLPYAPNTEYSIERTRSRNEGIVALPIAGPVPQNVSIVRLHAPIEFEDVYWSASREGANPVVPSPRSLAGNLNRIFLGGSQSAIIPTQTLAGHIFVMSGHYRYVIVGPEGLDSTFYLGKQPWETTLGVDYNHMPAANFVTGLVSQQSQKDKDLPLETAIVNELNAETIRPR